jgi:hypothetical protein
MQKKKKRCRKRPKWAFPPQSLVCLQNNGCACVYSHLSRDDDGGQKVLHGFLDTSGYLGPTRRISLKGRIQQVSKIKSGISESQAIKMGMNPWALPGEAHGTADAAWKNLGEREGTLPWLFNWKTCCRLFNFLGGDLLIKSGAAAGKTLLTNSYCW